MDWLEKVFLGTMAFTGLLLLFLFGLYFDLGAMIRSAFGTPNLHYGQEIDLIRQQRKMANELRAKEEQASENRHRLGRAPSSPVDYARVAEPPKVLSKEERIEREIQRLKAKGHKHPAYLKMQALYLVEEVLATVLTEVEEMLADENYELALNLLLEARSKLDEENLPGLIEVDEYIYETLLQMGRIDAAEEKMKEILVLSEKQHQIEVEAGRFPELEGVDPDKTPLHALREGRKALEAAGRMAQSEDVAHPLEMGKKLLQGEKIALNSKLLEQIRQGLSERGPGDGPQMDAAEVLKHFQTSP